MFLHRELPLAPRTLYYVFSPNAPKRHRLGRPNLSLRPDEEGLHPIANADNPQREADIVFVHGLKGSSHGTWRRGKAGQKGHFFWPEELGKDLPNCGIWSIGYPAGITHLGKPGMIIEKRAGNLAHKLVNAGLGVRPIIFITHSMGGLVVKSLIVDSQALSDPARKKIEGATRGIVFCGTPHRGSELVEAARILTIFLGGRQAHVKEMRANADQLDFLNDKFLHWHRQKPIPIESYAENVALYRNRLFARPSPLGLVVPRASANLAIEGHTIQDLDEDHLTMVKPTSRSHDMYAGVLRFIGSVIGRTNNAAPSPPQTGVTPSNSSDQKFEIDRIGRYAPDELIGRENETKFLSDAWDKVVRGETKRPHILTFVALGGEGKTSLIAKWLADLAGDDWRSCETAFGWSFYSQGSQEQSAASSDLFLREALLYFGDPEMAASPADPYEKGRQLARLVGAKRAILILDGLEPLQYSPNSATPGELKDQGIIALLKGLAANSQGLCLITTRYSIPELKTFWETSAREYHLKRLSTHAGVNLLHRLGLRNGTRAEFERLVEDVEGHALTLNLIGGFLARAFQGDIRKRDRVKLVKANDMFQDGHAFRAMAAYEEWLLQGGEDGKREVAILRILGLFDRPADAGSLQALRAESIPDLTQPVFGLAEEDWELSLSALASANLVTVNRDDNRTLLCLDAHPLLRAYFAWRLREDHPAAWQAGHLAIYKHLCEATLDKSEPTLEELQPLYHAIRHGCDAQMQLDALNIFDARIRRYHLAYSANKLGAFGSDLGALMGFFQLPWTTVTDRLLEPDRAWVLMQTALTLRPLCRLSEAIVPAQLSFEIYSDFGRWKDASVCKNILSDIQGTLGNLTISLLNSADSVRLADVSGDTESRVNFHAGYGARLHQAGDQDKAAKEFEHSESLLSAYLPDRPYLYSYAGFWYCDLLLSDAERLAWRSILTPFPSDPTLALNSCEAVMLRASQTHAWMLADANAPLLTIAVDYLTIGRTKLFKAILRCDSCGDSQEPIQLATDCFRRASHQDELPKALLTRALLYAVKSRQTANFVSQRVSQAYRLEAQSNLDEVLEMAKCGPMPLYQADVLLYRCRLFHNVIPYPWSQDGRENPRGPKDDLAEARRLIEKHGYWRRKEELEDAEAASVNW